MTRLILAAANADTFRCSFSREPECLILPRSRYSPMQPLATPIDETNPAASHQNSAADIHGAAARPRAKNLPASVPRLACLAVAVAFLLPGCAALERTTHSGSCRQCQHQCQACRNMMASGSQSATVQSHNGMAQESGVQQAQFMPSPQQSSMRDGQLKPVQFSQPMPPGCAAPCNTGPMMMSGTPVLPGMQIQEYPAETMLPMDMSSDCARQQAELRQQTVQLQQKMAALERRLESEQEAKQDLTASLESMNGEMDRMSQEIGYWRNETRRVEQSFEEQHQHDIAALDAIVELVEQVPDPYATSRGNGLPALPPATHGAP